MQNDPRYPYYGNPQGQPQQWYPQDYYQQPQQPYPDDYGYGQGGYGQPDPYAGYYQDQTQDYYQQSQYQDQQQYQGQTQYQDQQQYQDPMYSEPTSSVQQEDYQQENQIPYAGTYEASDQKKKKKKKRKGSRILRFIFFVATFVLISALATLGYIAFTYWNGQHEYDELAEYMHVDDGGDGPITLASFDVDWDALRAINSDVVGWVYVPDTIVNYPIVWKDHDDKYYLTHNFGRNSAGQFGAEYGCIMLSGYNQPDWTDQVNIIFGHHLRNGSMFSQIAQFYENSEAFNAHRTYYVLTPQGNFKLNSFACDKVPGNSKDIVIPNFNNNVAFVEYINARIEGSSVTPDPPADDPSDIEQVFAFSTCSEPDNYNRIINFCSVEEFLPAGSSVPRDSAIVNAGDVDSVESQIGERLS